MLQVTLWLVGVALLAVAAGLVFFPAGLAVVGGGCLWFSRAAAAR